MRKSIAYLVIIDLVFLLVAAISGIIPGIVGDVAYYLMYALLIALAILLVVGREGSLHLSIVPQRRIMTLALFAPTMLLIIGISFLTSFCLNLIGKTDTTDVSGPLLAELMSHALFPVVLEEMLFRYIPVRLLGARSPRAAIIVSSVLFALIHLSFFRIPYALIAGAIFAYITITTRSIFPSLILHFLNNALSVIWMRNPDEATPIILITLSVCTLLSVVYIVIKRRDYAESLSVASSGERVGFSFEMLVMTVLCLGAALVELR